MGTLGPSSMYNSKTDHGIKTQLYQQKYIAKVGSFQMLTPGQRDGIYREMAEEERNWLATQEAAVNEYEDILRIQDLSDGLSGNDAVKDAD